MELNFGMQSRLTKMHLMGKKLHSRFRTRLKINGISTLKIPTPRNTETKTNEIRLLYYVHYDHLHRDKNNLSSNALKWSNDIYPFSIGKQTKTCCLWTIRDASITSGPSQVDHHKWTITSGPSQVAFGPSS